MMSNKSKGRKYIVVRDVTKDECAWLSNDVKKGSIVYAYSGYTYGCIGSGVACSFNSPDKTPFFELPEDSIVESL